jgi:hypothetical protein
MRGAKRGAVLNTKQYPTVNIVKNSCWPKEHVSFQIVCTVLTYVVCVWEIPRTLFLGHASVELIGLACKHKLMALERVCGATFSVLSNWLALCHVSAHTFTKI